MFCISSQSHRCLFHSCTQDVPVAVTLTMTHHFQRGTCEWFMCKGSDRHQPFSCPVVLVSVARQWSCLEPLFEASHPCIDPDSSRRVVVRNIHHCPHLQHATSTRLLVVVGLADRGRRRWYTCIVEWTSNSYPRIRDTEGKSSNVLAGTVVRMQEGPIAFWRYGNHEEGFPSSETARGAVGNSITVSANVSMRVGAGGVPVGTRNVAKKCVAVTSVSYCSKDSML